MNSSPYQPPNANIAPTASKQQRAWRSSLLLSEATARFLGLSTLAFAGLCLLINFLVSGKDLIASLVLLTSPGEADTSKLVEDAVTGCVFVTGLAAGVATLRLSGLGIVAMAVFYGTCFFMSAASLLEDSRSPEFADTFALAWSLTVGLVLVFGDTHDVCNRRYQLLREQTPELNSLPSTAALKGVLRFFVPVILIVATVHSAIFFILGFVASLALIGHEQNTSKPRSGAELHANSKRRLQPRVKIGESRVRTPRSLP